MTRIHQRIDEFDFDNATPHEIAVLLEQVYLYSDSRVRDGGPVITAASVLQRYATSVQRKAAPELHALMTDRSRQLRDTLTQFDKTLRDLERESGKAST